MSQNALISDNATLQMLQQTLADVINNDWQYVELWIWAENHIEG